jgi:hypothetical protein
VNNAGHGYLSAVEEGEDAEVRKLFDVNYFGSVDMMKAVLPGMRAGQRPHRQHLVDDGPGGNPPNAYYSSTKFALSRPSPRRWQRRSARWASRSPHRTGRVPYRLGLRSMKRSSTPIADYADVATRKDLIKQFADICPVIRARSPRPS